MAPNASRGCCFLRRPIRLLSTLLPARQRLEPAGFLQAAATQGSGKSPALRRTAICAGLSRADPHVSRVSPPRWRATQPLPISSNCQAEVEPRLHSKPRLEPSALTGETGTGKESDRGHYRAAPSPRSMHQVQVLLCRCCHESPPFHTMAEGCALSTSRRRNQAGLANSNQYCPTSCLRCRLR